MLVMVAAIAGAAAQTAEAWQGRAIRDPLTPVAAFAQADRYRHAAFTEHATALRPCEPLPASPQRFECDLMFVGDSHLSGESLPLWVFKSRGHVCVFRSQRRSRRPTVCEARVREGPDEDRGQALRRSQQRLHARS